MISSPGLNRLGSNSSSELATLVMNSFEKRLFISGGGTDEGGAGGGADPIDEGFIVVGPPKIEDGDGAIFWLPFCPGFCCNCWFELFGVGGAVPVAVGV